MEKKSKLHGINKNILFKKQLLINHCGYGMFISGYMDATII
jgi:hypothetical protein